MKAPCLMAGFRWYPMRHRICRQRPMRFAHPGYGVCLTPSDIEKEQIRTVLRICSLLYLSALPILPIQGSVLDGFGNMIFGNHFTLLQIRNGAGHFQYPIISPGR